MVAINKIIFNIKIKDMKTSIIILSFGLLLFSFPAAAQIHLDGDQDVGIGTTTTNDSKVNLDNSSNAKSFFLENKADLSATKFGIENYVRNQGLGEKYGILNRVEQNSASTAKSYGIKNEIFHNGSDSCFGMYNIIDSAGSSIKFGIFNEIYQKSGTGNGEVTGITNIIYPNSSTHCSGLTNVVSPQANSTGISYGILNDMKQSGNGFRYGIYSSALGPYSWAGYFVGDIHVSGTISNPSDEKLKKNIRDFSGALSMIKKMKPKRYKFKDEYLNHGLSQKEQIGLIAQEIEIIMPQAVSTVFMPSNNGGNGNGVNTELTEIKSINYQALIPILIQGMKEQQQRIEALEAEVANLKKE